MVGAISSTSSIPTTSTTTSTASVSAETAKLKTELANKQAELAEAALKAEIAATQTAEKQGTQQTAKPTGRPDANAAMGGWEGSRPPEGKVSGAVMSVLMQLSQQGMIPPDSEMHGAGRPSAEDRYAEMDSDDNGAVTKDEFVAARPEHASEEEATSFYSSIDTEGTGSISQEQFASVTKAPDGQRGPGGPGGPAGHMGPPGGAPDMEALQSLLASLTTSSDTEAVAA